MNDTPATSDSAPVSDHRPVPRGVLPRGMQTWLMVGVAAGMIAIIFATGRPEAPVRAVPAASAPAPNPDRLREYQERLRATEARAAQEAQVAALTPPSPRALNDDPPAARAEDPIVADRRRREYESLFAGNVVLSRRPETQRPDAGRLTATSGASATPPRDAASPSIDDIADAAVRATARANPGVAQTVASSPTPAPAAGAARGAVAGTTLQRPT